ncbi:MAG: hypothetical protein NT158_02065 [Cyanobacteria bacterium]|nr:hypothetical protein [Cyanobacteriota bacterium]
MNKSLTFLGLAAMLASASAVQAAPTTFTFSADDDGQTVLTKSVDGINLTIDSFNNPGSNSAADSEGLAIFCNGIYISGPYQPCQRGDGPTNNYSSFQMTFDTKVKILSYNLAYTFDALDSSTTYLQGILQSVQNDNSATGLKFFTNQFIAAANVPILVSTVDPDNRGVLQIDDFTVEKVEAGPVTVPAPLPLAGAATAFGLSRQLRRRIRRSSGV